MKHFFVWKSFRGINDHRNVSFSYPNTTSERPALKNVTCTIHPGQLVVIVGCNGSGKSTLIKLLNRLYDPSSGVILVDGIPIQKYRLQELRRSIAMLTQDHQLFPLSVAENIALGAPDEEGMKDARKLEECVRLSGADRITNNFSEGFQTILDPVSTGYISFYGQGNEELGKIFQKMKKSASLSGMLPFLQGYKTKSDRFLGGEKQRLMAFVFHVTWLRRNDNSLR